MSVLMPLAAVQVLLFWLCCHRKEQGRVPLDGVLPARIAGVGFAQMACEELIVLLVSDSHPVFARKIFFPARLVSVVLPKEAKLAYSPATYTAPAEELPRPCGMSTLFPPAL